MRKLTDEETIGRIRDSEPESKILSVDRIRVNGRLRIYVTLECSEGHRETRLYENIIRGHGCKACASLNHRQVCIDKFQKYSINDVQSIISDLNYEWLNEAEYVNAASPIRYKCKKCGNIGTSNLTNIVQGRGCRGCSIYKKKTTSEYSSFVESNAPGYRLIGEYKTCKDPAAFFHEHCGGIFYMPPDYFSRGSRCPFCNKSSMEQSVIGVLNKCGIKFIAQKRFEDCRNKRPLPFDFYLPEYNTCIECNGQQHYEAIDFFGGSYGFIYRKANDDIKSSYCAEHNITLITIPYWEIERIESIINDIRSSARRK